MKSRNIHYKLKFKKMKVLLIVIIIFSQFLTCLNAQVRLDSIDAFVLKESITNKEFRQILNLQFSKLITGNTFANIGNYASIKTTDETLSISASILNKNGDIISFEATGGATEGVFDLFNSGDLSTNISGQITYHIVINPFSNTTIKRNSFERDDIRDELQKIVDNYNAETIAIEHKKELLDLKFKLDKVMSKKVAMGDSLKSLIAIHKANPTEKLKLEINRLTYEVDKVKFDINTLNRRKKKIENDKYFEYAQEIVEQKYDKAIIENNKKVINQAISGISLYWVSIGYGIRNDGFKLFDLSLDLANQIQKKEALTHQLNIALSHYDWENSSNKDIYWSAGASLKIGNNFSSLDKLKIRDFQESASDTNRELFLEQNVFVGDFKDNLNEIRMFFDYYKFYKTSSMNNIALHLNPSLLVRENTKPITSLWTGIVIPFKKTEETSSILNFEIFYSFNDLFNTSESNDGLIGRNTIGFSAIFPINFFKSKKQ